VRTALFAFVLLLCACRTAAARERLAVIVVVDHDARLADNLTEVIIAKVAEKPGYELVGTSELRARLVRVVKGGDLGECLSRPDCLSEVGIAAGVTRAVVGNVHRESQTFELSLALTDTKSAAQEAEVSRSVSLDVAALIAAVQWGVDELFEHVHEHGLEQSTAKPNGHAPAAEERAPALSHLGQESPETPPPASSPEWFRYGKPNPAEAKVSGAPYVGYAVAALAVASLTGAAITGAVATGTPVGNTRSEAQRDLERRKDFAIAANGLWVAGGVLGALSAIAFVWKW
jgi:hypothetical protein